MPELILEKDLELEEIQLEEELTRRKTARFMFEEYCTYINPRYKVIATQQWRNVHRELINIYQDVANGIIKRLQVTCPPRLGKSELWAINLPTWFIGKDPTREFVLASYSWNLATKFGKKARDIVVSPLYKNVFPDFELSHDQTAKANWETKQRWGMYTVWVEGSLTGSWGNILYIDDPVKDMKDAQSPVVQEATIEWYDWVLTTRKQTEDTAIVLTMTRWDINDLAWYLDKKEEEWWERWTRFVIKAINDEWFPIIWPGKRWPDYFIKERDNRSFKVWQALYQQNPIAISGNVFKPWYERFFLESDFENATWLLKSDIIIWLFVDPAFSTSSDSDDIALGIVGQHKHTKDFYIFDVWAETKAPSEARRRMFHLLQKRQMKWFNKPFVSIERSNRNKNQIKFKKDWLEEMEKMNEFYTTYDYVPVWEKGYRIVNELEPLWELSKLFFNSNMPQDTQKKMFEQFNKFPNLKHDDIIDMIAQGTYQLRIGIKPSSEKKKDTEVVRDAITWQPMSNTYTENEYFEQKKKTRADNLFNTQQIIDPITGKPIDPDNFTP